VNVSLIQRVLILMTSVLRIRMNDGFSFDSSIARVNPYRMRTTKGLTLIVVVVVVVVVVVLLVVPVVLVIL